MSAASGLVTSCCGSVSSWAPPASHPRWCAVLQMAWAAPDYANNSSLCFTLGSVCMGRLEQQSRGWLLLFASMAAFQRIWSHQRQVWKQQYGLPLSLAACTGQSILPKIPAILS